MGLFDFLKGRNKANNPTPPKPDVNTQMDEMIRSQKIMVIKNTIASLGVNVQNLNVDYYDNTASVVGLVKSEDDKNAIINALNGIDGVFNVDDRIEVEAPQFDIYVVRKGDSLSRIAKQYYGDAMRYKEIFEANRDILDDPNKIFPGQELKIPRG